MTDSEIFEHLFSLIPTSDDTDGAVAACLVRDGNIVAEAVSSKSGVHAEYALLQKVKTDIQSNDVLYTTVEPCGFRTPGGRGELMGDCTTNIIAAGIKSVLYAALDPHASEQTRGKFKEAGVICEQVSDINISRRAVELFNSTCSNKDHWLPII